MSRSVAVLTVSDRAASGTIKDESGPAVSDEVTRAGGWTVVQTRTVPDDVAQIQDAIRSWTDDPATAVGLVLTTGGTGFGVKDVTPEVGLVSVVGVRNSDPCLPDPETGSWPASGQDGARYPHCHGHRLAEDHAFCGAVEASRRREEKHGGRHSAGQPKGRERELACRLVGPRTRRGTGSGRLGTKGPFADAGGVGA